MTPNQQLEAWLDEYDQAMAKTARAALKKLRALAPGAVEMVYDNYNGLVIGFAPGERPSEAILSLVLYYHRVSVCFLQAVKSKLPDPEKLLEGSGKAVRNIKLLEEAGGAKVLDKPAVRKLIMEALDRAAVPLDPKQKRRTVIRAVAKKRVPRKSDD